MTLCLVTDRARLPRPLDLLDQLAAAVAAGVDLIQIRERSLEAGPLCALVTGVLALTRGSATRVVVNDRLDVALACGADGVHLRGDSIPVAAARRLAPVRFLIGKSVHTPEEARMAAGADYLIAGTVFATSSKIGAATLLGVDGLRAIVHESTAPVLAIGGITLDRIDAVASAGAAGVAAIGLFMDVPLDAVVRTARRRFDSARSAP